MQLYAPLLPFILLAGRSHFSTQPGPASRPLVESEPSEHLTDSPSDL